MGPAHPGSETVPGMPPIAQAATPPAPSSRNSNAEAKRPGLSDASRRGSDLSARYAAFSPSSSGLPGPTRSFSPAFET